MLLTIENLMDRISYEVTDYYRGDKTVAYRATVMINFPEYRDAYHPSFAGQVITVAVDLSKAWKNPCVGGIVLSPRDSLGSYFMTWLRQKTSDRFLDQFFDSLYKEIELEHGEIRRAV